MSMSLSDLHPAPGSRPSRRRLGRGHGSGRGKTAGRGTKGQKARAGGHKPRFFEGGQNALVHRMPTKRGLHFRAAPKPKSGAINIRHLNQFAANQTVDLQTLVLANMLSKQVRRLKILGDGELSQPLTVAANQFSAAARTKIEAAGGTVIVIGQSEAQEG